MVRTSQVSGGAIHANIPAMLVIQFHNLCSEIARVGCHRCDVVGDHFYYRRKLAELLPILPHNPNI